MASERRNKKARGYDKAAKRPKRGVTITDIEKLKSRPFRIIDTDMTPVSDKTLVEIPTREDKGIQQHQRTRTLHNNNTISVPGVHIIRHELPHKSLHPSMTSVHRKAFSLPNHYIQYQTAPDGGHVSFSDFFDLKKDDIDWLIQQLLKSSVNDNDHQSVLNNNTKSTSAHNISGQHLVDILSKQYHMQSIEYRNKLIESMKQKQQESNANSNTNDKLKKEHSVSSTNSSHNAMNGLKRLTKQRSNSPNKKDVKTCDPFMTNCSFSLSLDDDHDANMFMMREHSMSPSMSSGFNMFMAPPAVPSSSLFESDHESNHDTDHKTKKKNIHSTKNDLNVTIGNTRLTRLSLSKLMHFLEYSMFERAKYKSDPERYLPLNDVLHTVTDWDASYDVLDIERVYYHWIERRRNNGGIEEKSLIRRFQEPPDSNDDDSNTAFRPRVSDERHVATRRQTKKPKKNTKESYIRLEMLMETIEKQCYFWKKQLQIEEVKTKMALKGIAQRQSLLHQSSYVIEKAKCMDAMVYPDAKHNALFNTFSSPILQQRMPRSQEDEMVDVMRLNDNLNDVRKYKKKWQIICNRIVPSKTDVILDAMEENTAHIKSSHIDDVCNTIGIVPLSRELAQLRNRCNTNGSKNTQYHWEMNVNHDDDEDDEKDITYSDKEERMVQTLSVQRSNSIQERLLQQISWSYDTDVEYKWSKSQRQAQAVAIPSVSANGALQIKVYHGMRQGMDHIEYEATQMPIVMNANANGNRKGMSQQHLFDEFELPIETQITPYTTQRKVWNENKRKKYNNSCHALYAKRTHKRKHNIISPLALAPPPKRQKVMQGVPLPKKAQSVSHQMPQRKKKNQTKQKQHKQKQQKQSMQSMLEQNKHRQQYIELKKLQIQSVNNNEEGKKKKKKKKDKEKSKKKDKSKVKKKNSKKKSSSSSHHTRGEVSKDESGDKSSSKKSHNNNNEQQTQGRLPTPDSNPRGHSNLQQLNPTPPPPPNRNVSSMPLSMPAMGAMPHLPKFDVKFDPSMMKQFKMDMSGTTQTMSINNTPPTPPAMGRPKNKMPHARLPSSAPASVMSAGRPVMPMTMPSNDLKRKTTNTSKHHVMSRPQRSFMSSTAAENAVIAMPPNPSTGSAATVPSIPQLPQLPAHVPRVAAPQNPHNASRRVTAALAANNQNKQTQQRHVQRTHPPFPSSFAATSVPPPPSAMPSYNRPQRTNMNVNNQNSNPIHHNSMHHRIDRSHSQSMTQPPPSQQQQQQHHLPQFGATPSINQSHTSSSSVSSSSSFHRTQHRPSNTVTPMHPSIPLSPRQMSEIRHNRISSNTNVHSSSNNNRNNAKEIIELDQ